MESTMFQQIADSVKTHIDNFKEQGNNNSQVLRHFGIGSDGFDTIIDELKQTDWFKYKRKEIVANIIHKSVANYIHRK